MDFGQHYTTQQEAFRGEVRAWLEANVPTDLPRPLDAKQMDADTWRWVREFKRALGQKGWLHPTYPKQYGGGGLTAEHEVIIGEELERLNVPVDGLRFHDNDLDLPALMVWGTEEQKQRLLRPRLQGDLIAWQLFTEPEAGSDLASLRTRAVRDGDDWVISGEKVFVGGDSGYGDPSTKVPDQEQLAALHLFCLAITDQHAPRHHNMGYFIIPGDTPGVTVQTLDLLVGHGKRQVYLDNVRVPSSRLIGGDSQGWQVAQTTLEIEHGAQGGTFMRDAALEGLIGLSRKMGWGKEPRVQQAIAQAWIGKETLRLYNLRNGWMYNTRQEVTYHGSQFSLWQKLSLLRVADAIREVAGPWALLDYQEAMAPAGGEMEAHQRESLAAVHPGGSVEIQKVIMARRIGVSRTKERAAPTPSTAGTPG